MGGDKGIEERETAADRFPESVKDLRAGRRSNVRQEEPTQQSEAIQREIDEGLEGVEELLEAMNEVRLKEAYRTAAFELGRPILWARDTAEAEAQAAVDQLTVLRERVSQLEGTHDVALKRLQFLWALKDAVERAAAP